MLERQRLPIGQQARDLFDRAMGQVEAHQVHWMRVVRRPREGSIGKTVPHRFLQPWCPPPCCGRDAKLVLKPWIAIEGCRVTGSVSRPSAATPAEVMRARAETEVDLPASLVALWSVRNGLLAESGVAVYSAGDIGERNATYEVAECAPGFLLVGDDSGGRGFLLRTDDADSAVFSSGLGDLDPADFHVVSEDFASWVESLGPAPCRDVVNGPLAAPS
ncbi:hypothetical protein [Kitasatospora sp. NPDC090091]|uniref:hypothetical protein n=1 Tax=Kitasatospora sp. NPDC090091 TaxID=3364081 RepID=UPI0038273051